MNRNNYKFKKAQRKICKNIIFTIAYYNALEYYPTVFFIWKNLIDIKKEGKKINFIEIAAIIEELNNKKKITVKNGMYKIAGYQKLKIKNNYSTQLACHSSKEKILLDGKSRTQKNKNKLLAKRKWGGSWYKRQIQKNKISVQKIKKARQIMKISQWVPYLKQAFLTGTLAMKRGSIISDWDVLLIMKKDRIWLGRLFITIWLTIIGKRRHGKVVNNKFCLNQFIVESNLIFKENNEFLCNELLVSREFFEKKYLREIILQVNASWIKKLKPNYKFKKNINVNNKFSFFQKAQATLEYLLEKSKLAKTLNRFTKKIMIKKIINNYKTYLPQANIKYDDTILVFLPSPQQKKIRQKTFELLTKIS